MRTEPGTSPHIPPLPEEFRTAHPDQPDTWKEALVCLASARLTIIREESRHALGPLVKKLALLIGAALCGLTAWTALWAGMIGVIADAADWPWYYSAFAVAALHLVIAGILFALTRTETDERFPITCEEFKKDCEWLNQLTQQPK